MIKLDPAYKLIGAMLGATGIALVAAAVIASAAPDAAPKCGRWVTPITVAVQGDADGDGRVTARDAGLARRYFGCDGSPTPTHTPVPPTSTPVTPVLPPPLPTPPPGVPRGAMISITPREFDSGYDPTIYSDLDCQIARSISYYLAKQTGHTIWIDCYAITTGGDAIDLGSEPSSGRSGAWLDGFAGAHVQGFGCAPDGVSPCDYGFKAAYVLDPDGDGPTRGGQGLNRNAILAEVEAQLGGVLLHNADGSPRGIRIHSVRNGGGYAGGGTYCATPLGAQIDCADPLARGYFGFSHVGDWLSNYYAALIVKDGLPRPFSFETPLRRGDVDAVDAGCWDKYHDASGRAGACDVDVRGVNFHEALHGLCTDSHDPYIGSTEDAMSPAQVAKFLTCMGAWVYPLPPEFLEAIR